MIDAVLLPSFRIFCAAMFAEPAVTHIEEVVRLMHLGRVKAALDEKKTLRVLCVLGVTAVNLSTVEFHRRVAENAEVAQRSPEASL